MDFNLESYDKEGLGDDPLLPVRIFRGYDLRAFLRILLSSKNLAQT